MLMNMTAVNAIAASINIRDHLEAARLVLAAGPLYRDGRLSWTALVTACRLLYADYDSYHPETKAMLLREARVILRLGELASTSNRSLLPAA